MSQRVAVRAQLCLHQRPRCARAKGGELAAFVQVQQPVHAGEIHREDGAIAHGAVEVPGHAGASGKRDDHPAVGVRQVQQFAHLLARFGVRHAIGHRGAVRQSAS